MSHVGFNPQPDTTGLHQVFLDPGSLYCSKRPAVVRTVLGSCVSVCLADRRCRAGGMNHYVLPSNPGGEPSLRYGDVAIEQLIFRMCRLGCQVGDLRAKVFGGAAVLPFGVAEETVGAKNVAIALDWLRNRSIPILARHTGGEHGLLVRLYTSTGSVIVRPIAGHAGRPAAGRRGPHEMMEGRPAENSLPHQRGAPDGPAVVPDVPRR